MIARRVRNMRVRWGRGFGVFLAEAAEEGHGVLRWVSEATTGG